MDNVILTLVGQHDLSLVALAALVCAISSFAGMGLLHRATSGTRSRRWVWISVAAVSVGFGIWSTHFIAMMAYSPGFTIGYEIWGTLASLLIAIVVTGLGFTLASFSKRRSDHVLGGIVVGFGVSGMHYVGMSALMLGGDIAWQSTLVIASITAGAALAAMAVMLGAVQRSIRARLLATGLLTLAICSMHFTAMGAADFSNCYAIVAYNNQTPILLAIGLGGSSLLILGLALFSLFLDTQAGKRSNLETLRLDGLADAAAEGLVTVRDDIIVGANLSILSLTGHERDTLIGMPVTALFDSERLASARKDGSKFLSSAVRSSDNILIPVEFIVRQVDLPQGPSEVVAVRDIREQLAFEAERAAAHETALESERRFRFLVQSVTDYAIYMLDPDGKVANWNAGAQRNKGYTSAEIVGQNFSVFFSAEDQNAGLPQHALRTALEQGKYETEGWRYRKDGSRFWAMVIMEAIRDADGDLVGFAKITRDVTRQHEDAQRIATASRNLELSLTHMSQGLALFGADERIVIANVRLKEILGIPPQLSVNGLGLHDLAKFLITDPHADAEEIDEVYHIHRRLIDGEMDGEIIQEFPGAKSIRIVHRPAGDGAFVSTFEDISERQQSEAQILFMAHHDGLTGLPNRGSFSEQLSSAIARVGDKGKIAVLGIDLDRFKEVNDHLGHAAGDNVLKQFASRIGRTLADGEMFARFGGDEFAAFKVYQNDAELYGFIERVEAGARDRFNIDKNEIFIGASVGVAIYPEDGRVGEKLIGNADMAMYRAKQNLTERVCYYESEMDEAARDRRLMARDLWDAIERDELLLNFQVQKSVKTGQITGYEALLRWSHPKRGMVSPMDFIPVAEECGAILPIGEWVMRDACRAAATWEDHIKLAVNISPVQLGNANLIETVKSVLADTGLAPHRLELEVTESTIIADKARALNTLRQIKELGVTIAIDDFGTGYSSLETLRSFPFDKIKLDRSFMSEVETSKQSKAIIRAILALGRGLEVPVLAEGVETGEQLIFLGLEGCDEAQGYFLGRPQILPASQNINKLTA